MRRMLLGAALLTAAALSPNPARANRFGWPAVVPAYPVAPAYAPYLYSPYYAPYFYPPYYVPYPSAPSYFRPDFPPGANAQRNWRDTWQDDGVKVHGYSWH